MQVTLVHVHVKPDSINDFIEASRLNHEASIKEPGNRRFDILQSCTLSSEYWKVQSQASAPLQGEVR